MKRTLKTLSVLLALCLSVGVMSGCSKTQQAGEGKIKIKIGEWPDKNVAAQEYNRWYERKLAFEAIYPEIEIEPDTYIFGVDTFMIKASANQLPNLYRVPFTEPSKIIKNKFALDITDALDEFGWTPYMNEDLKSIVSDESGRIYGIPYEAYAQGLFINKKIFREAGLVNGDGSIMIPKTFGEMREYAKIVTQKTGKNGYIIPTIDNCGGWHFMNIAWNFGTNFMEQIDDGTWKATFNTQSAKDALQYIKDLRWIDKTISSDSTINLDDFRRMFATGQVAMGFFDPPAEYLVTTYGMSKDDIFVASIPEGPAGRFSQMGGSTYMVSRDTTPEQLDAIIKWIDFLGRGPKVGEEQLKNLEADCQTTIEEGGIVLDREAFMLWLDEESNEKKEEIRRKYCNIDPEDFEHYYTFEGVKIKPEEPISCQQLYAVLDNCLQEVITNENADVDKLIENACNDFQVNHLDKENK